MIARSVDAETTTCAAGKPCRLSGLRVLVVNGNPERLMATADLLLGCDAHVITATSAQDAALVSRRGRIIDAVVTAFDLHPGYGPDLLATLRLPRPWLPGVIIGGTGLPQSVRRDALSLLTIWLPAPALAEPLLSSLILLCCPAARLGLCPSGTS